MAERFRLTGSKKLAALLALIFVLGVGTLILLGSNQLNETSKGPTITSSTNRPVEVAPKKETYNWKGGSGDPKYIVLPTISTEGFIQKADIDQNKQIAVPSNIHMAAWFIRSSIPGDPGLSIIDGHVDGRENAGIFKKLGSIKPGDQYSVELGSGAIKKFKVIKVATVPVNDSTNILFSQDPTVSSQLNLITCGGTFDTETKSYDLRVIVSSAYFK